MSTSAPVPGQEADRPGDPLPAWRRPTPSAANAVCTNATAESLQ
jgi:hypothetical protein